MEPSNRTPSSADFIIITSGYSFRHTQVSDAHCSHTGLERFAKCSVIVTDEIFGRRVELCWIFGDGVNHTAEKLAAMSAVERSAGLHDHHGDIVAERRGSTKVAHIGQQLFDEIFWPKILMSYQ